MFWGVNLMQIVFVRALVVGGVSPNWKNTMTGFFENLLL